MPTTADLFEHLEPTRAQLGHVAGGGLAQELERGLWQPMQRYVEQFYTPRTAAGGQRLEETTNLANLIDVALFKQVHLRHG